MFIFMTYYFPMLIILATLVVSRYNRRVAKFFFIEDASLGSAIMVALAAICPLFNWIFFVIAYSGIILYRIADSVSVSRFFNKPWVR